MKHFTFILLPPFVWVVKDLTGEMPNTSPENPSTIGRVQEMIYGLIMLYYFFISLLKQLHPDNM